MVNGRAGGNSGPPWEKRVTALNRAFDAFMADLNRQAVKSGCTAETNGRLVQVDGSFDALAALKAALAAAQAPDTDPTASLPVN